MPPTTPTILVGVQPSALPKKRGRPAVWREIWGTRALVKQLVLRDLIVRYTQTIAGLLWAIGLPLLTVLSGVIVRIAISQVSGQLLDWEDVLSLASRAIPWSFFAGALSAATVSVSNQATLISKIYFAREVLPLSAVLGQLIDTTMAVLLLTCALAISPLGISLNVLWAGLMLLLLVLFTFGVGLITSCANLFFRDVRFIVQVLVSFGPFVTPVILPPELLGARAGGLMLLNPLSPFIQGFALSLTSKANLLQTVTVETASGSLTVWSPRMLLVAIGLTAFVVWLGLRLFRKYSMQFAEAA